MTAVLMLATAFATQPIAFADLPPALRSLFPDFPAAVQAIERRSVERVLEGERDHLIFYVLQSRRFTLEPRIEPALAAREYRADPRVPASVQRRFRDFLQAPPRLDTRIAYLRQALHPTQAMLESEYARVMQFLYAKEFDGKPVTELYTKRGFNTDTEVEANYAVSTALAVLKRENPALRLNRVLIVGPGADFAPRTAFLDELPPQSYQPFAITDALLAERLSTVDGLRIHCVDVNARVVETVMHTTELELVARQPDAEYLRYFKELGQQIGVRRGERIRISPAIQQAVTAQRLNILTERLSTTFDLIVATNLLLYFDKAEQALALTNIASMLKPGGLFITNELNPAVEATASELALRAVQGRTVHLGGPSKKALFDAFVIFRR